MFFFSTEFVLVLVHLNCLATASITSCYHPNGALQTDPYHQPCSNSSTSPLRNICCAIGRPNAPGQEISHGGPTADLCLENGLCQNIWTENGVTNVNYHREECTANQWSNGLCLNVCLDGSEKEQNVQLTPCDGTQLSEKWCCGNTTDCCNNADVVTLAANFTGSAKTPSASISMSSSATTSATSPPASTAVPTDTSSSGISPGTIAGIVVGSVSGLAITFALGYAIAQRRFKNGGAKLQEGGSGFYAQVEGGADTHAKEVYAQTHELSGVGDAQELSGNRRHI